MTENCDCCGDETDELIDVFTHKCSMQDDCACIYCGDIIKRGEQCVNEEFDDGEEDVFVYHLKCYDLMKQEARIRRGNVTR